MIESLNRGDFYILCPDNDVPRSLDERRILWGSRGHHGKPPAVTLASGIWRGLQGVFKARSISRLRNLKSIGA